MTPARDATVAILSLLVLLALASPPPAIAHDVRLETTTGPALLLDVVTADGIPFSYAAYEILAAGEDIPFQTGRTDANGRIAFAPGRLGSWRLVVTSADGHGLDTVVETTAAGEVRVVSRSWWERAPRLVAGVGIVLGVFGLVQLAARHRQSAARHYQLAAARRRAPRGRVSRRGGPERSRRPRRDVRLRHAAATKRTCRRARHWLCALPGLRRYFESG